MTHAASPSLISLGLTTDASLEGSSFRGGLAASCVIHALVLVMAMFVRFHSDSEQPFRSIDVALISLPAIPTTAPNPKPVPTPTKKTAKAQAPKTVAPPQPSPTAPPVPAEDTLPPLPTETASERLSESLSGAINSILVPQKQEAPSATVPPQEQNIHPKEDQSPLIDNLRLPSAPPTIARPKQLQRSEPLKIPSRMAPSSTSVPKKTQAPSKPPALASPTTEARVQPAVKPAPAVPSLSEVTPFKKSQQTAPQPNILRSSKMEEALQRNLPNIPTPTPAPNVPEVSRKRPTTPQEPRSSTQPKMSETVKKLMEGLKSTRRTPIPKEISPQRTKPSPKLPPSELDQRIAKLSIPDVAPAESIKQRLQLLEMQATGKPGQSASKPSPGKNRYLAMVEDAIDGQWVAPPLLASTPLVVMKFRISRSGEISRIYIAESSGHAHYDSAAQRAVQAVNPLPPFPSDISESFFDVQYRFIKD
jgi:TonB family protein